MKLIRKMTREEMWEEFESQLKCTVRTPITMSYNESIKLAEMGIKDVVARWKKRLEQEPKWIPVSEKLPEKNVWVLVTVEQNDTCYQEIMRRYNYKEAWTDNIDIYTDEITAWMPLPESYKVESKE